MVTGIRYKVGDYPNRPKGLDEPTDEALRQSDKLYCSFCGVQTQRVTATFGNGPLRKIKGMVLYSNDHGLAIEDKVMHTTTKVVACPKCCLNVTSGVQFPSNE